MNTKDQADYDLMKSIEIDLADIAEHIKELREKVGTATAPYSAQMRVGKTEAETLSLNGWGPGTVLEGEGRRIVITGVRGDRFFCRWDNRSGGWRPEDWQTTLSAGWWRKIGQARVTDSTGYICCTWRDSSRQPEPEE